jgi:hypothetical protein
MAGRSPATIACWHSRTVIAPTRWVRHDGSRWAELDEFCPHDGLHQQTKKQADVQQFCGTGDLACGWLEFGTIDGCEFPQIEKRSW